MKKSYTESWSDYISEASTKLAGLDVKINQDNLIIEVLRFILVVKLEEWSFRFHMNSSYFFHIVLEGRCKVVLADGEFEVKAGEFYLIKPSVYYQPSKAGNERLIMYYVNVDIRQFDFSESESTHILRIFNQAEIKPYKTPKNIIELCDDTFNEAHGQRVGFYNNIKHNIGQLLTEFARRMAGKTDFDYEVPRKVTKNSPRFSKIKAFVEANIHSNVSSKDIAKHIFLSERQVCRIIMDVKGLSTREFIENAKFEKVKQLLKDSSLTIKQISEALSFSSECYFIQSFRKSEGITPGKYRKVISNQV